VFVSRYKDTVLHVTNNKAILRTVRSVGDIRKTADSVVTAS